MAYGVPVEGPSARQPVARRRTAIPLSYEGPDEGFERPRPAAQRMVGGVHGTANAGGAIQSFKLRVEENERRLSRLFEAVEAKRNRITTPPPPRDTTAWTFEEGQRLRDGVERYGHHWDIVAEFVGTKEDSACRQRWHEYLRFANTRRTGYWTEQEDRHLKELVFAFEDAHADCDFSSRTMRNYKWEEIAKELDYKRTPMQCRNRWDKYSAPPRSTERGWALAEDMLLLELHSRYGSAWADIASFFSGRTTVGVASRINHCCKKTIILTRRGHASPERYRLHHYPYPGKSTWTRARALWPAEEGAMP